MHGQQNNHQVRYTKFDIQLDQVINKARHYLKQKQHSDGHWLYELEADATIPAEYIMLEHFLDEIDQETEKRLANYLRNIQGMHGGWPLFYGGDFDLSASVKAYLALRLVGDDPNEAHMKKARLAILEHGGAASSNVFTRIALAIFGQVPWRAVPSMPVEVILLPRWFPFHISKIAYWSRTVVVPLLVLMALKPRARNPRRVKIDELFLQAPHKHKKYLTNVTGSWWGSFFLFIDKCLKIVEPFFPKILRKKAINKCIKWITERLNGEDGLGAIFPAMANVVMMMDQLDYPKNHPDFVNAKEAVLKLLTIPEEGKDQYCQPCLSPVWDTGLALHALAETGEVSDYNLMLKGADWLKDRQITDLYGDWSLKRPHVKPGGWAFQYNNPHYPDVDDTAVVAMILNRLDSKLYHPVVERAKDWILGMQSKNGGWGAFDIDNTYYYLNNIPFADHGALLDPPTVDVSARCVSMLAQLGYGLKDKKVRKAVEYLKSEQEEDGSWFGRWGTNYIYGTWSVLCALNIVGEDMNKPYIKKSVAWLLSRQNEDGGWGEDGGTYWLEKRFVCKASTASQTAWAVMALMACGHVDYPEVIKGINYLIRNQTPEGGWEEKWFTAVGFPRVFYLRYHGYSQYFPLWALARYRTLQKTNSKKPMYGM
ncbi:MAG: squalene--hopene cyclase [Alphaproteobacteria bacterium]|nr:squalene--hopene cyclase [Alphaproteobacteria bacterium]